MTNSDMDPFYKGKYIEQIFGYPETFTLEAGTILVQEIDETKVYFQLAVETFFHDKNPKCVYIERGSAIGIDIEVKYDSLYCMTRFVRIPNDKEVEWYEKQNTV